MEFSGEKENMKKVEAWKTSENKGKGVKEERITQVEDEPINIQTFLLSDVKQRLKKKYLINPT